VRSAEALVAAGRAGSIEEVVRAGIAVLDQRDPEWLAYARKEAADGFAELDRGEGILATVDEHMAAIDELAGQ
jgi:hypothetical protein